MDKEEKKQGNSLSLSNVIPGNRTLKDNEKERFLEKAKKKGSLQFKIFPNVHDKKKGKEGIK